MPDANGTLFRLWAPLAREVELELEGRANEPLAPEDGGYFALHAAGAGPGDRYRFRVDGNSFPDPASRFQPEGVHGPSQVVDTAAFTWKHPQPAAPDLAGLVVYELHVGTFTPEGTFAAAAEKLPYLAELGVNTVELMPVHDFPGDRNWGYDPAALYAPAHVYGTPAQLAALVDEAHGLGLRVLLDVVYNHFGPDGAYFPAITPDVLTDEHHNEWGKAIAYSGELAQGVRNFFLENALAWLRDYRLDGLRLDATFAIIDDSPTHFLAELSAAAAELAGPERILIAEDPRNLRDLVLPREQGGMGLDAVWADDFHHQIRVRLAGDDRAYYADFTGSSHDIARTIDQNWFYTGQYSANSDAPRGTQAHDLAPEHFVYCIQNHDQVGNRPRGERLHGDIDPAAYRAASALLLFLPQLPMLFMGQEWAASSPFLYFTDHGGELGEAVSEGRKREFASFGFGAEVPDPQDVDTFRSSKLDWRELSREPHAPVLRLYRDLLRLRRELSGDVEVAAVEECGLLLRRKQWLLAVAFEGGGFDLPEGLDQVWTSEDDGYAGDPLPARLRGERLEFRRAGAVIMRGAAGDVS